MERLVGIEEYISEQQEKDYFLLEKLDNGFESIIEQKRKNVMDKLLDVNYSKERKAKCLCDYFLFRFSTESYCLKLDDGKEYGLKDLTEIAERLFNDNTFIGSDAPVILKGINWLMESFTATYDTATDVILALHYYRTEESDESISCLAKVMGYYCSKMPHDENEERNYYVNNDSLSRNQAIDLLRRILGDVDNCLRECSDNINEYDSKFNLSNNEPDRSMIIDLESDSILGKTSPIDFCFSRVIKWLSKGDGYNEIWEPYLEQCFGDVFEEKGDLNYNDCSIIGQHIDKQQLLQYIRKKMQTSNKSGQCWKEIYAFLKAMNEKDSSEFERIFVVNDTDFLESQESNDRVKREFHFKKLARYIRYFYTMKKVAELIPELSDDEEKRWRRKTCSRLYDIFYEKENVREDVEESGLYDLETLTRNELETEERRNKLFKSILSLQFESCDELLKRRSELMDEARIIAPEDFEFLDRCANELSNRIIERSATNLQKYRERIETILECDCRRRISQSVSNTLATAEMLFDRYGTEEYAQIGFDYSGISAMYYQAFEKAYNELIWTPYATYLNDELVIDGEPFQSYLQNEEKTFKHGEKEYGYLPPKRYNRGFYTCYKKETKKVQVNNTCMYGSFVLFLSRYLEEVPMFFEWLAKRIGFASREELSDGFKLRLKAFSDEMDKATDNRNNASHGGHDISLDQCVEDRGTVLERARLDREFNLSLIQKLLGIVFGVD